MVSLTPIPEAVVPRDSDAAQVASAPNYDEFQGDHEVEELIISGRAKVLAVTMPHVRSDLSEPVLREGGPDALERATSRMRSFITSGLVRKVHDILWVYEILNRQTKERQIGIGGYAKTKEIRTNENSDGIVLRNEEVRDEKAVGRRDLIEATGAFIGVVNNAVEDTHGNLQRALEAHTDSQQHDFEANDEENKYRHRVWLIQEEVARQYMDLLAAEPYAYVADGNHRSAAACMLGDEYFSSMFFPADSMRIGPYNRLVKEDLAYPPPAGVLRQLQSAFRIKELSCAYQPDSCHDIGLYTGDDWYRLRPLESVYEQGNPVQEIDASIVHQKFFQDILGIADTKDPRLTFVGANKDVQYLIGQVQSEGYEYAVTLPPVSMRQIMDVCKAGQFMPPKSTWFQPKVRSGLVVAMR